MFWVALSDDILQGRRSPIWGQWSPLMRLNLIQKMDSYFLVICYSAILHLPLLKWYKFGVGTSMGLQDIGSRVYPWYGNHCAFECVVWCFTSFVLTSNSRSCNVSLWHFYCLFLLVSITLVLEISKLLIKCFHGNLTPLKLLAKKPRQSDVAQFQLQWRNLCCNPFNKPHHFIRKKNQLMVVTS